MSFLIIPLYLFISAQNVIIPMANFNTAFEQLISREGYIADTPGDKGGKTVWGISSKIFPREVEKMLKMKKDDSLKFAEKLYQKKYWDKMNLTGVESQSMATKMLDMGVHMGSNTAGRILQNSLNEHGAELDPDGIIGSKTLEALNGHSAPDLLMSSIKAKQMQRYMDIFRQSPSQRKFKSNWLSRVSVDGTEGESSSFVGPRNPEEPKSYKEDESIGSPNQTINPTDFNYLLRQFQPKKPEGAGAIMETSPETDFNSLLKKTGEKI